MTRRWLLSLFFLVACSNPAADSVVESPQSDPPPDPETLLKAQSDLLKPLHAPMGDPEPGDWLLSHEEDGQTFAEYLEASPVTPRGERRVLYVQPLGPFSAAQRKIVDKSAEFMGIYFDRPVKVLEVLPLSVIPKSAQRTHPDWGVHQILAGYVLEEVLRPRLADDAATCLGLTAVDLWPGEGWNFVFGYASLRKRVGVWSIFRNGDPAESVEAFRLCLLRTLKTATHETGHMFTIEHCIAYECNMCGCNNREESDRRPLALCPECLPKVVWAAESDAVKRFEKLKAFCEREGLEEERAFYARSLAALR